MTLSIMIIYHYAECHCAECRDLFIGMLSVIILSVVRLNVVTLSVAAPDILGTYENYCEPTYITWNMDGLPVLTMLWAWQKHHFTVCGGWIWTLFLGLMRRVFCHCATATGHQGRILLPQIVWAGWVSVDRLLMLNVNISKFESIIMESLLKGNYQYGWPPCTN